MSDSISASSVVEVSRSTVDNSPRDSDPNSVTDSLNNKEEGQGTDLVKEAPVSTVGTLSSETVPDSSTTGSETNSHPSLDPANLHYEGDICIYTDPATKYQYAWNSEKYEWIPKDAVFSNVTIPGPTTVNKQKRARRDDEEEFDDDDDDDDEDNNKPKGKIINTLDMSKGSYGFENGVHTYKDPSDGAVYFWDEEKKAWFPKVDDDFLAHYQMSYGFIDNTSSKESDKTKDESDAKNSKGKKRESESGADGETAPKKKAPQEPTWFQLDDENNTKVYVSNLPCDITENEFVDLMQKCGLVMKDLETNKMKIKLYSDPKTGFLKGDALCTYIKKESVELALKVLDGSDVRGKKISVERAKFTMKGDSYDPSLKPKKKRKKDKEKLKKMHEKLFAWQPDKLRGQRAKHEQIVIIKNLFDPKIFDESPALILEYKEDLREEVAKCGAIKKVIIYDRHPEGVAQINFKEAEAADACIQLINGRWFGQRKIIAEQWDGKTKYRIEESEQEAKERLKKWDQFLESADAGEKSETPGEKTHGAPEAETADADAETADAEAETADADAVESDSNTRSSAGSGDETEEEEENTKKMIENETEGKSVAESGDA
ncbi:unnamed protein product [Bemisia tabaci]|uniref:17S U2 SnRNP complex component HTATSF1 n=1 Tax=Bemisia tabaci TaxID=7038 RepID=A0A9P0CA05_BEMTA|nr:unnamed protein product [Bemisia tabaci]